MLQILTSQTAIYVAEKLGCSKKVGSCQFLTAPQRQGLLISRIWTWFALRETLASGD